MLLGLVIRDIVLIDRLDLAFAPGLTVLTGETGAGKSILLDALGLALGARAEASLLRAGSSQATVTAEFELPRKHRLRDLLNEQGLAVDDSLLLRRQFPEWKLAELSAAVLGHPGRKLSVSAVTGTNGKTTTAYLLEQMLRSVGRKCVLIGTIETHVGDEVRESPHTTPEASDVLKIFADGVAAGATEVGGGVSS